MCKILWKQKGDWSKTWIPALVVYMMTVLICTLLRCVWIRCTSKQVYGDIDSIKEIYEYIWMFLLFFWLWCVFYADEDFTVNGWFPIEMIYVCIILYKLWYKKKSDVPIVAKTSVRVLDSLQIKAWVKMLQLNYIWFVSKLISNKLITLKIALFS